MARSSRRSRGSRGRRGGLLVTESAYAQPIVEPANFIELDITLSNLPGTSASLSMTWLQLLQEIKRNLGGTPAQSANATVIQKFRVTSLVFDPLVAHYAGADGTLGGPLTVTGYDLLMSDGNHYQPANNQKPLRVQLANKFGSAGQWMWINGITPNTTDALPGATVAKTWNANFCVVQVDFVAEDLADFHASQDVHVRVAWTD